MYKREIMAQLRGWAKHERKRRKPLILRGARQVGKTTLVEEFGKEFDSFISLNLEKDDAEVFRRFKTASDVWQYVCLKHHITQDRDKRTLLSSRHSLKTCLSIMSPSRMTARNAQGYASARRCCT